MSDLNKLKKQELVALVKVLEEKISKLEAEISQTKAKHAGLIGVGATKNPLVR